MTGQTKYVMWPGNTDWKECRVAHGRVLFLKSGIVRNANGIDEFGGIRRNFAYITDNRVARNYPVPEQAGDAVSLEEVGGRIRSRRSRRRSHSNKGWRKTPFREPQMAQLRNQPELAHSPGRNKRWFSPGRKPLISQPRKKLVGEAVREEAYVLAFIPATPLRGGGFLSQSVRPHTHGRITNKEKKDNAKWNVSK